MSFAAPRKSRFSEASLAAFQLLITPLRAPVIEGPGVSASRRARIHLRLCSRSASQSIGAICSHTRRIGNAPTQVDRCCHKNGGVRVAAGALADTPHPNRLVHGG